VVLDDDEFVEGNAIMFGGSGISILLPCRIAFIFRQRKSVFQYETERQLQEKDSHGKQAPGTSFVDVVVRFMEKEQDCEVRLGIAHDEAALESIIPSATIRRLADMTSVKRA